MEAGRIEAVLFDVDGTLVDSIPFLVECFVAAAAAALDRRVAPAEVLPLVGIPLHDMFACFEPDLSEDRAAACVAAYRDAYRPSLGARSPLFAGVEEVLEELSRRGLALGVVSGKSLDGIRRVLEPLGILGRFSALVGADFGGPPKPAPDGALAAVAALGASPGSTLVVGDSLLDIRMGVAAGMRTCGVTTGTATRAELELVADAVLDRLADLPAIIARPSFPRAGPRPSGRS